MKSEIFFLYPVLPRGNNGVVVLKHGHKFLRLLHLTGAFLSIPLKLSRLTATSTRRGVQKGKYVPSKTEA